MAVIELTKGFVALVDDDDAERVLAHAWRYVFSRRQSTAYAMSTIRFGDYASRRSILLHRFIMDAPKGVLVDHRNRDGLDCRRENLRLATAGQNAAYARYPSGATGFRGVKPPKPRCHVWRATITVDRKCISLGSHKTPEEAARAYDAAALKYFGEFAVLNFPEAERVAA